MNKTMKHECLRCGESYVLREGCDPTPECDSCSHVALAELREKVRAYLAEPSIDGRAVRQSMRAELTKLTAE